MHSTFHLLLTRNGRTWKETAVEGTPISPKSPIEAATERMTRITPNILRLNFFSAIKCLISHEYHFSEVEDTLPNANMM